MTSATTVAVDLDRALPEHLAYDKRVCEQARLSRDARFDGLFFTAVHSTRIYCRPICPAPWAKKVTYFDNAAAAEAAGFRPCLRCRPELAPGQDSWRRGDTAMARALQLIDGGALAGQSLSELAQRVHLSERQLRRLFVDKIGASPHNVHATRRLLFAKQLLTETALPITQIALAAGFRSLRRFNAAFQGAYRMAPRDLRRKPVAGAEGFLTLRLAYRPPYAFAELLEFLRGRALAGIERVDATSYARVFRLDNVQSTGSIEYDCIGWMRLDAWPGNENALRLQLHCPQPSRMLDVVTRLRRMFDLDADPNTIGAALTQDARLRPLLRRHPGLRLPGGWDGFEIAVRAVLGQQVSVAAARTLASRLVQRFGTQLPAPIAPGLDRVFPSPAALADVDLIAIGLTRARAETVRGVARALIDGRVDFRIERTLEEFVACWTALPGIGAWTAHYIALRALGHPDAFPADDLILRRAASDVDETLSAKALTTRAQAWRPWRAYAVMQLWRSASDNPKPTRGTHER